MALDFTFEIAMLAAMLAVFLGVISIFAIRHWSNPRNRKSNDIWLFEGWQANLYDALFQQDARKFAPKVGINVSKYLCDCQLNHATPDLKRVIIDRILGLILLLIGVLFTLIIGTPIWFVVFSVIAIFPIFFPIKNVEKAAARKRQQIADDLPRFLDLLYTALLIGMPIDQAIDITASHLKGTALADEMLRTIADSKVGANNWQTALAQLAEDYEVDSLSDFVLDITNAYNNGTSIMDAVARQSKDIKQTNLVSMKERASKLTSTILFPILFFKIIPILLLMCIPIIYQLSASGFAG